MQTQELADEGCAVCREWLCASGVVWGGGLAAVVGGHGWKSKGVCCWCGCFGEGMLRHRRFFWNNCYFDLGISIPQWRHGGRYGDIRGLGMWQRDKGVISGHGHGITVGFDSYCVPGCPVSRANRHSIFFRTGWMRAWAGCHGMRD